MLSEKFCGEAITFFRYDDNKGDKFFSAKQRYSIFIENLKIQNFLLEKYKFKPIDILNQDNQNQIENSNSSSFSFQFFENGENVFHKFQSISFELVGSLFPQLIHYPFQQRLVPFFKTLSDGIFCIFIFCFLFFIFLIFFLSFFFFFNTFKKKEI